VLDIPCTDAASLHRGDISAADKKAYIAAMLCIMSAPSKLDKTKFPGAKSRYDDFVVVHMNQTLNIHGTVSFSRPTPDTRSSGAKD
jgi:tyrosinase